MAIDNINDPWRNEEEQPEIRPAPPPAQQQNIPAPRAAAVPQPAQQPAPVQQPMEMDTRQWQRVFNEDAGLMASLDADSGRNPDSDAFAQIWALPEDTEEWRKTEKERILTDPAYRERQRAIDQTLGMLKDISDKSTSEWYANYDQNGGEAQRWKQRDPGSGLNINPDVLARMMKSQRFRDDTSEKGEKMLGIYQNAVQREWEAWKDDKPGLGRVAWDSMQRGLNMSRDLLGAANDFFAGALGNINDAEAKYRAEMRGRRQQYEAGFQGGERQQSFWAFFDKDQDKTLGDFAEYVVESIGEQMGIMGLIQIGTWTAEGAAAAFTGGASIPATEAIRQAGMAALKQGTKAAAKGAISAAAKEGGESAAKALLKAQATRRIAAATGGAAMDLIINTGDTMDTLAREALERGEDISYGVGALESVAKTAIDYPAGFVRIARNNPLSFMRGSQMKIAYTAAGRELWRDIWRGTKEVLVDSLGEGAQEMAQKLVDRAGNRYLYGTWLLDGEKDAGEAIRNDVEEGMAGLVAGAAFSAPGQFGKIKRERKEIIQNREEGRKIFNADAGAPVTRFLRDAVGNADFEALSANDQAMLLAAVRALAQKNVGTRRTKVTAADVMKEGETDPMKASEAVAMNSAQGGWAEAFYGARLEQLRKDMSDAGRAWFDAYCQGYGQSTFKDYDAAVASATDEQRASWKSDVDLGALRRNEMKARQVGKVRLENPGDSILFDDSPKGDGIGGHVWIRGYVADGGEVYWTVGRSDGGAMPMFEGEEISSKDFSGNAEQQYYASLGAAIQFADKLGGWARWNDATADEALINYAQSLVRKGDEETGKTTGRYAGRKVVIVRSRRDLENWIDPKTGRPEPIRLSEKAKATMLGTGPTGLSNNWEGYTDPTDGTIYINRSKVSSPLSLAAILDHETFHDSLDKLANDSGMKLELKKKFGIGEDATADEQRIYTAAYVLGLDVKGRAIDLNDLKSRVEVAEETMAVDAEGARRVGLDKEGAIRSFLRQSPVLARLLPKYIAGKFGVRPESEEQIGDFLFNVVTKGHKDVDGSVVFGRRPNGVDGTNGIKDRKTMLEHIRYDSQRKAAESGLGDVFGRIFNGGDGGGNAGGAAPAPAPRGPRTPSGGTGGASAGTRAAPADASRGPGGKAASAIRAAGGSSTPFQQMTRRAAAVKARRVFTRREDAERMAKENGGRMSVWENGDGTFAVVWNNDLQALEEEQRMYEMQADAAFGANAGPIAHRTVSEAEEKKQPKKQESKAALAPSKPAQAKQAAEKTEAPKQKKEPAKKPSAEKPVKTEPVVPEKPKESKPEAAKPVASAKPSPAASKLPAPSNKGKPPALRTLMPNAKAATKKMLDWLQKGTYSPGTYGKTPVRMLPIKFRAKNGSVVERHVVVHNGTPYILLDMGGVTVPWSLSRDKLFWVPAIDGASAKVGQQSILGSRSLYFVSRALMQDIGNGFAVIRGNDFADYQTDKSEKLDAVKTLDAATGRKAIDAFTTKENDAVDPESVRRETAREDTSFQGRLDEQKDAADPKTKPDKLAQMAKSSDDAVRLAVATNPSSTKDALRPLATDANPVVASVARSRFSESELKQIDAAFEKAVRSGRTAPAKADAEQTEKTGSGGKRHGFRRRGESSGESSGKRSYIPLTKETSDAIAVAFRRNLGIEPNDDPAGVKESVDKAAAYVKAEFKKLGMSDADISAHMGAFYDGVGDIVSGGGVAKESGKGEKNGNGKETKSLRADKRETTKPTVSGSAANWTPPKAQMDATAKSKTRTNAKGQKTLKTEPVKAEPLKTEPVAPATQKKRGQSEEAKSRVAAKKEADAKQREENAKKGKKKRSLKANQTVDLASLTTTGDTDENGRPVLTEFGWALRDAQDALDVNKNNARGEERVPMSFAASNALTLSQLIGYANQLIERINKPTLSREEKEKIADANEREKYVTPEEREKAKQQLRRGDWSPERTKAFRTLKGKKKAGTATEEELNRERGLARNTRRGVIPRIKALLGNDEAAHGVVERMFRGEDVTADLDAAIERWNKEAEDKNIIGYLRGGRTQRQRSRVRRLVDYEARRANETEEQRARRLANRQELEDSRVQTDDGTAREEKPVQQRERYDTQDKIAEAPKNDVDKHVDGLLDNPQGNSLADIVTSIPQTREVQRRDGTTTRQRARRVRGRAATVISGIHNPTTIRNLTLALESAVKANEKNLKNLELGVQYAGWLSQARGRWQTLTGTVWGKSTAQDLQARMEPYSPLGMDFGPKTKMGATTAIQLGENVARLSDEGTSAEAVREAVDSGYTEDVYTHLRNYLSQHGINTRADENDILTKAAELAETDENARRELREIWSEYGSVQSGGTAAIVQPPRQSDADYNADDDTLDDTLDGHASSIGTLLLSRVAEDYILPDGRTKRDVMAALRAAINRVGGRNWAQLTDEEKDYIYNDTGWEMRADGEWGYRIPPIMFNDDARERIEKAVLGKYREEMSLFDALDDTSAQMLRAMDDTQIVELDDGATIPDNQFGDIKVIVRDLEPGDRNFGDSAWFDPINREIVITTSVLEGTTDDSALALDKIITHEMQHVIQEASEWSDRTPGRATSGSAYHNAMSEVDARAAERMVEQAYDDADAYEYGYAADVELEPSARQEAFEDVPRSEQIDGRINSSERGVSAYPRADWGRVLYERYGGTNQRRDIASNPETPPTALARLTHDTDPRVLSAVALNPNTGDRTLNYLASFSGGRAWVAATVARRTDLTDSVVDKLAHHKQYAVRVAFAKAHPEYGMTPMEARNWRRENASVQKQADAVYPDASAEIKAMPEGNASSFRSLAMTTLQNKRPDLDAQSVLDEVFKFPTAKERKVALHWVIRGGLALPQDAYKVADALSVAEKAKVDPFRYKSPDELLLANKDFKPSARPIDPATVPELSDARDEGDGIVSYLVQDDRQGQAAMRRIIDTHWGEDANPWCLLARVGEPNPGLRPFVLTEEASQWIDQNYDALYEPLGLERIPVRQHHHFLEFEYERRTGKKAHELRDRPKLDYAWSFWENYSALPKRVAFKNGRLLAFMATERGGEGGVSFSKPENERRVESFYKEYSKIPKDDRPGNFQQWMMEEHPEEYDAIAEDEDDGGDAINTYQFNRVNEEWWDRQDKSHPDLDWARDGGHASSVGSLAAAALGITGLSDAERMELEGVDRTTIWRKTGWWRGLDRQWRVEIPDIELTSDAGQKLAKGPVMLEDLIGSDSQVLKAYPDLRDISVRYDSSMSLLGGDLGSFDRYKEEIRIAPVELDGVRYILAHEIQHAIQSEEGFEKGASVAPLFPMNRLEEIRNYESALDEAVRTGKTLWAAGLRRSLDNLRKLDSEVVYFLNNDQYTSSKDEAIEYEIYRYLAAPGEIEARMVQKRLNMTPEQRAARPPWEDYDVPQNPIASNGHASSLGSLAGTAVGVAYGVTNRDILSRIRRALNDPTLDLPSNRTSMLAIFNEGSAILEKNPQLADELVKKAIDKMVSKEEWAPKNAAEYTILLREMLLRTLRRADAEANLEEAAATGGDVTTAQKEKAEALAAELEFAEALRNVKRTQAHELLINKVLMLADYSYAGVIQSINKHLEKTGDSKLHPEQGRPLTAEEIKKYGIAQYVKKIAALEKKLADAERKLAEKNARLEALKGVKAAAVAGNKAKSSGRRVYSVDEAKQKARDILAARLDDGGSFDPNDYADTWGAIRDLVKMIGDAIAFEYSQAGMENMPYEQFVSALEAECNDVFQSSAAGENAADLLDANYYRDLYAGVGRLDRIAPQEQTKAEAEIARMQELTQRMAELERIKNGELTPERYGKGPISLENVDKELADVRSELNRLLRESGLSDPSRHMKKSPLDRAKETLARRILEIDDALERGVTLTGRENVALKRDAEEKFLREYRARLQALYDDLNGPARNGMSDTDRAAEAVARLEGMVARTQQEIEDAESGLYDASKQPATNRREISNENVSSLKSLLSDLRRIRDAARESADPVAAAKLRLEQAVERQKNRKARFENAVREGVAKRPAQFSLNNTNDKEWVDAYFAAEKAKRELGRIKGKIAYDRKTLLGKAWATANSIKDTMRAYMASGDISGLGVQCAWYVLQHPRKAMKTIIPGLQAFFSEEKAIEVTRMIMSDPDFITMKEQMGVSFSLYGIESGYTQTEEAFARGEAASRLGVWADNKYLQMSERGFIVPINLCRYALAKEFLETMRDNRGENAHLSAAELKYLGRVVNIATGKGDFFGNAGASNFLSQILWAPSRVSSQIQILALPLTIWAHGEIGADLRREILARSVVKPLAHLATMMVLLAMAGRMIRPDDDDEEIIGTDPTSSKFGKVKIGNRYMSLTGGLEQYITLLARTATGFKRDKKGKKIDLRGGFGRNIENEWLRWAKNKMRPDISMAWQFLTGHDALGNELGPSMWGKNGYAYWFAKQGFIPITGGDVASAFSDVKTNGLPLSMIFAAMAFVGWNGSNFGETPFTKDLYRYGVAKEALDEGRNEAAVRNDPAYRRYLANSAALEANLKEQRRLEGLLKNGESLGKDLRGNKKYRQLVPREVDETKRRIEELQMDFHMTCWPDVYRNR